MSYVMDRPNVVGGYRCRLILSPSFSVLYVERIRYWPLLVFEPIALLLHWLLDCRNNEFIQQALFELQSTQLALDTVFFTSYQVSC